MRKTFIFTLWLSLISSSCIVECTAKFPKKRVCVIGAGASGLASVKQLSDKLDKFQPIVFEKKSDVGGLWIYTDNVSDDQYGFPVQSSIYANLRTNGPKEILAFPDYQNFTGENRSCVRHETVLQYLRNYTDHYNLRQYIRFNTLVEKVTPIIPRFGEVDWKRFKWRLTLLDSKRKRRRKMICDSVMVCNGHFSTPYIPEIPGIADFPGRVLHSHVYRRPEGFSGQRVVILGASASGLDLAAELSPYAKMVYLSHRNDKIRGYFPSNVIQVAGVVSANGNQLTLQDNSTIVADTFIFCTGYREDMAFLDSNSGVKVRDKSIDYLYKYIVNIKHPSMGFVGVVVSSVLTFARFHLQAQYYLNLLEGKAELPNRSLMLNDTIGLSNVNNYTEWDYYADLARIGGMEPLPSFYERGMKNWLNVIAKDSVNYKDYNMFITNDGNVKIIEPFRRKRNHVQGSSNKSGNRIN